MREHSYKRDILRLSTPAIFEGILNQVYSIVDAAFLGHFSPTALAAVGLAFQILMYANIFMGAVAVGLSVLVSNYYGAGRRKDVVNLCWQGLYLGIAIGFLLLIAYAALRERVFAIFPMATQALKHDASVYLGVIALAGPVWSSKILMASAFRALGETFIPFLVSVSFNVLNIFLDWVLIFGKLGFPKLGLVGAGLATCISQVGNGMSLLALMWRGVRGISLREEPIPKPATERVRKILHFGWPFAAERLLFATGGVVFSNIVLSLGEVVYSAHRVGITLEMLGFVPGFALQVVLSAMSGQLKGRGQVSEIFTLLRDGLAVTALLMGIGGATTAMLAKPLASLLVADEEVVKLAVWPVRILGSSLPIIGAFLATSGVLRGTGDTRSLMYIVGFGIWGVRIPLAFVLARTMGLGLIGAWLAIIADDSVRAILALFRFRSRKWISIEVIGGEGHEGSGERMPIGD